MTRVRDLETGVLTLATVANPLGFAEWGSDRKTASGRFPLSVLQCSLQIGLQSTQQN